MAAFALLEHYVDYLTQPAVLLTAFVIFGGIFLLWFENYKLGNALPRPINIPGCYRLGLYERSNLDDQSDRPHEWDGSNATASATGGPRVKALFTYPIKSCRGVELKASEVHTTGLKYDRVFTFAHLVPKRDGRKLDGDKHEWRFITQREFPKLALVRTELWVPAPRQCKEPQPKGGTNIDRLRTPENRRGPNDSAAPSSPNTKISTASLNDSEQEWATNGGCLIVRFPFESEPNILGFRSRETVTLHLPLVPSPSRAKANDYTHEILSIWKDRTLAVNVTNEINRHSLAKLQTFLGTRQPLALFRIDATNLRQITRSLPPDRPNEKFHITFADAFPVNLLNLSSVDAVNALLAPQSRAKTRPDARRFRANVYISGVPAFAEETWKQLTIGRCIQLRSRDRNSPSPIAPSRKAEFVETDGEYYVACRTARCKLVNVDPTTGERDRHGEPDTTLRANRVVDEGAHPHPVLGMQMIPLFPQGVVRVGDEVEVLAQGEHVYEKMFA